MGWEYASKRTLSIHLWRMNKLPRDSSRNSTAFPLFQSNTGRISKTYNGIEAVVRAQWGKKLEMMEPLQKNKQHTFRPCVNRKRGWSFSTSWTHCAIVGQFWRRGKGEQFKNPNCKATLRNNLESYLLMYIPVMYSGTKLVVFNFCASNILCLLDEGSKNLQEKLNFLHIISLKCDSKTWRCK